jgi:hypothetical protein
MFKKVKALKPFSEFVPMYHLPLQNKKAEVILLLLI